MINLQIFNEKMSMLGAFHPNPKMAVAVSGGSDSLALCFMLDKWIKQQEGELICLTIDHDLRVESSKEAEMVENILNAYNIKHKIIKWLDPKPISNLQKKARLARYQLLTDYCKQNNIAYLATGHQQNDQAENFIIRAEHGSGVYGLDRMPSVGEFNQIKIIRTLLDFNKQDPQNFLKEQNIEWIEDPSNYNERFTRVKVRNFLSNYPQWIAKLAYLSKNLSRAKDCIEYMLKQNMEKLVVFFPHGDASIEFASFKQLPQEIKFRMLAKILQIVSNNAKTARAERIERLLAKIETGNIFKASTLSGCLISRKKDQLIITREKL